MGFADSNESHPLWQYRRRYLELYKIKEQLQQFCENEDIKEADEETSLLLSIARFILATHDQPATGNQELLEELLAIINSTSKTQDNLFYRYGISLLITLLIRHSETASLAVKLSGVSHFADLTSRHTHFKWFCRNYKGSLLKSSKPLSSLCLGVY